MTDKAEPVEMEWSKIATLLHVAEKSLAHGPILKPIFDAAVAELNAIANPPKEEEEKDPSWSAKTNPGAPDDA